MVGPKALDTILAQLEGFEAPAAAWEAEILPARLVDYDQAWLDERCLAGHLAWMRLRPRSGRDARVSGLGAAGTGAFELTGIDSNHIVLSRFAPWWGSAVSSWPTNHRVRSTRRTVKP